MKQETHDSKPPMTEYDIEMRYVFTGTYTLPAENADEARKEADRRCGAALIHYLTESPDGKTPGRNFPGVPEKTILSVRKALPPSIQMKKDLFDKGQMEEIRLGLDDGLTEEQIELYADPKFNANQMAEIRGGIECGLTEEQIRIFAKPELSWKQMRDISLGRSRPGN